MSEDTTKNPQVESQRELILEAKKRGPLATLKVFAKFSGPGWLQSATTLGGGSLASALYLGVLGGFCFMWLQPFAMILGIISLSAISYITLSISKKPMRELNSQISPILGYGWAVASMIACLVNAMPQFSLGVASLQQNILSGMLPEGKPTEVAITAGFFLIAMTMIVVYAIGGKGVKVFEVFIKLSVALIVLCFFGVVAFLAVRGQINWGNVWAGFVPNVKVFFEPSPDFMAYLEKLPEAARGYWSHLIVQDQRDVVISAAAMAVGINMTFLFPYSMLKKGWDKDFRSLAIFDLCTGLFIPFLIATSCIVIASASQFHAKGEKGLVDAEWTFSADAAGKSSTPVLYYSQGDAEWKNYSKALTPAGAKVLYLALPEGGKLPPSNLVQPYTQLLNKKLKSQMGAEAFGRMTPEMQAESYNAFSKEEREVASMLVRRDAMNLAGTLAPLVGEDVAKYIFGFGVFGMAMNATLMNMLICGLCFAEICGKFGNAKWQICGSALVFFSACVSLFLEGAKMWLVIYAGIISMVLLPVASGAFLAIMNSRRILGESMPRGLSRLVWNSLMGLTLAGSSVASLYVLYNKLGIVGPAAFFGFMAVVVINYLCIRSKRGSGAAVS